MTTPGRNWAVWVLAAASLAFIVRQAPCLSVPMLNADEPHFCAVAARVAAHGGPVYGNALATKGPVIYWLAAAVFRVAGPYHMVALRASLVLWWVAAALVLYAAARAAMGRAASLAAAGAFLLTAAHPGFRSLRTEALVSLPLAAAAGLCLRGVARRQAWSLALAGAAAAVAFLTKQPAGLALPVLALCPLLAWATAWHARRHFGEPGGEQAPQPTLAAAVCGAALVVGGFAAMAAAVWLWYVARGAGREFVYCVWSYNWAFARHTPTGGFLPSPGFLLARVARYVLAEPLLPMALVGGVVGLLGTRSRAAPGWRACAAMLGLLLAAMWLASSPGDIGVGSPFAYVAYSGLFYAPMCLLVGVAVETARRECSRRDLLIVAATMGVLYLIVFSYRPASTLGFRVGHTLSAFALWRVPATVAALLAAAWLFGGWRLLGMAAAVWAALFVSAPAAMGWMGAQLCAALAMVSIGVLWHAVQRNSMGLLSVASAVLAATPFVDDWLPQVGAALGGGAWLWWCGAGEPRRRRGTALIYAAPATLLGLPLTWVHLRTPGGVGQWLRSVADSLPLLGEWLQDARLPCTLALCGVLLAAWTAGGWRGWWSRTRGTRFGLLACVGAGSLGLAALLTVSRSLLATPGAALALAAALALSQLFSRSDAGGVPRKAPLLLLSGCAAAGLAALAVGTADPEPLRLRPPRQRVAEAMRGAPSAYVWGRVFDATLYVASGQPPAAPQVCTWVIPEVRGWRLEPGAQHPPLVATLEGVDRFLSRHPPACLVAGPEMPPLDGLPTFGPILATRYRLAATEEEHRVYRLRSTRHTGSDGSGGPGRRRPAGGNSRWTSAPPTTSRPEGPTIRSSRASRE